MRIYNRYILYLTLAAGLVNTVLAFGGQKNLGVYFTINTIVYLAITLLYVRLNPRARMALDILGSILFTGVMVIVVVKAIDIVASG